MKNYDNFRENILFMVYESPTSPTRVPRESHNFKMKNKSKMDSNSTPKHSYGRKISIRSENTLGDTQINVPCFFCINDGYSFPVSYIEQKKC